MKYITGIHALNIPCKLDTCGDWHASALKWENITIRESETSVFGDYGIEYGHKIPFHEGVHPVANHIRALLDLIDEGNFSVAEGMKNDFICNDKYTGEIFRQVKRLVHNKNWEDICDFMHREYGKEWRMWSARNIRLLSKIF